VDRIKRFDPSKQAATYWNRWKEAGLNRLILSTLMFAVSSSRHKNALLARERFRIGRG
jgi:hypothetical protein